MLTDQMRVAFGYDTFGRTIGCSVPTSLLGAAATSLTAIAGWLLDRRAG